MPKLWNLAPPDIQRRVSAPPLDNASPVETAKEIYDVLDNMLGDQIAVSPGVSIGPVVIDASGLRLFSAGKNTIYLDVDGDAFFGSDLLNASTTSLVILNNDQAYNGEQLSFGDIILGDNSSGAANMFWDRSTGKLQFRGGTTMAVEIGTDGALIAGTGSIQLDADGLTLNIGTSQVDPATIKFKNGSDDFAELWARYLDLGGGDVSGTLRIGALSTGAGESGIELATDGTIAISIFKDATNPITVLNPAGEDWDFRVEGANVDDVFKVDGGLDQILAGTTIAIKERAASQADIATYGQLWVKNDDPNILRYTDGDGAEFIVDMTAV